jgi:hypothetical protein
MHPRTTAATRWGAVYTSVAAASAAVAVAVAAAVVATDGASLEALDRTRVLALVLVLVVVAADRLGHWFSWLCGDGCCCCCEEGLGSWLVPGPYVCRSAVQRGGSRHADYEWPQREAHGTSLIAPDATISGE